MVRIRGLMLLIVDGCECVLEPVLHDDCMSNIRVVAMLALTQEKMT